MLKTLNEKVLDKDWINLMEEAKQIGLEVEDVKLFLTQHSSMNSK
ncbi:DNA-binding anti-repressor SinI [Sediminibacillus halophilus]|uniref:Antagonist of SinR/anti-repressor of SlrR n=1 Tax=Sediminibacillus halophilus TaxID=482461 RepID=A0A1G9RDS6_9BACI|nr:antagonist of SinR/anti-repressor of SlrR [Sediminibacillus halophilus]